MSKRKKKSPLRNEFTDALNEEIAERKIVERTQPKIEPGLEPEPLQQAATLQKSVEVEKIPVAEVPVVQTPAKPAPKVEEPPAIQIVEIKTDPKLEERILREADNTFFDEKPPEINSPKVSTEKPPRSSIYHSKALRKWEAEQEEKKSAPPVEPPKNEQPQKMSYAEKSGVIISVVMLIYAFANFDKPLFFLALSLVAHFLGRPVGALFGKHSAAVQNALRTFSIVIFFGAVLFLFTN